MQALKPGSGYKATCGAYCTCINMWIYDTASCINATRGYQGYKGYQGCSFLSGIVGGHESSAVAQRRALYRALSRYMAGTTDVLVMYRLGHGWCTDVGTTLV